MKTSKVSFDFSDIPELIEMLRMFAANNKTTQKAVVVDALESYFADKLESSLIKQAASKTFAEWDNEEDKIYDSL